MRCVLLLLALATALASATLSGTFCSDTLDLPITNKAGSPFPSITYTVSTVCLSFTSDQDFVVDIEGIVKNQNNPVPYTVDSHCTGVYFFGSNYQIDLTYPASAPSYCSDNTDLPAFCPWICTQLGGSWTAYFAPPLSQPLSMAIDPDNNNPALNWMLLPQAFPMACNTSSCGSAADIIPPAPIPDNSSLIAENITAQNILTVNETVTNTLTAPTIVGGTATFTTVTTNTLNTQNETVGCWFAVGTSNPSNKQCGDATITKALNLGIDLPFGSAASIIPNTDMGTAQIFNTYGVSSATSGTERSVNLVYVIAPTGPSTATALAHNIRVAIVPATPTTLGTIIGLQSRLDITNVTGASVLLGAQFQNTAVLSVDPASLISGSTGSQHYGLRMTSTTSYVGGFTSVTGVFSSGAALTGIGNVVSIVTAVGGDFQSVSKGTSTSSVITNAIACRTITLTLSGAAKNVGYEAGIFAGATLNAAYYVNSDTASCGAGFVMGLLGDTCFFRGRAGAVALNTGQDIYSTGYACFGTGCTSSAPTAASTGVYDSNVRVVSSATIANGALSATVTNGVLAIVVPASGAGTVTSVSGTSNQVCVATGTTTPVVSICPAFSWSGTTHAASASTSYGINANSAPSTTKVLLQPTAGELSWVDNISPTAVAKFRVDSVGRAQMFATDSGGTSGTITVTPAFIQLKGVTMGATYTNSPLSTSATIGFFGIPYANGAITTVPGTNLGTAAEYWDDTNKKHCFYSPGSSAWVCTLPYTLADSGWIARIWSLLYTPVGAVFFSIALPSLWRRYGGYKAKAHYCPQCNCGYSTGV